MKERPILFNGEMVWAILNSRKTQTRRVIKNQKRYWKSVIPHTGGGWKAFDFDIHEIIKLPPEADKTGFQCPYGQVGDRLWVRETWASETKDMKYAQAKHEDIMSESPIYYRATDGENIRLDDFGSDFKWHPSIFMPRWASRIMLEIINIRVERIQDISAEDVEAEGFMRANDYYHYEWKSRIDKFATLWDSINIKRGYGWDTNPWVWVIEFRRVDD